MNNLSLLKLKKTNQKSSVSYSHTFQEKQYTKQAIEKLNYLHT